MPIKDGKVASEKDIRNAIQRTRCVGDSVELVIHMPKAYPNYKERLKVRGGKHAGRAWLEDAKTGRILVHAPSAYALLEKIEAGWKDEPNRKEGLMARNR